MADTAATSLPRPSGVSMQIMQARMQSAAGNLLMTRTPDSQLAPRRFLFSWRDSYGATADAIRRHYREHPFETFSFTLPRTGEVVWLRYHSAPSVNWTSAASASISAEFDEMLAHS
jgi:hypothetical protein